MSARDAGRGGLIALTLEDAQRILGWAEDSRQLLTLSWTLEDDEFEARIAVWIARHEVPVGYPETPQ